MAGMDTMQAAGGTIDVESIVDRRRFGGFQLRIVLLCLLVQVVDGFDNQAIAFVAPALARDWHLARSALGPVFAAGAFGTLLGSLSMGPLGDRFGRKTLMLASLLLVTTLMLLTTQCSTIDEVLLLRFAAGFPLGALIPSTIVMANEWSPLRQRAAMVTMMACGFALGAALGGLLAAWLLPRFGWESVFTVGAAGTFLLFLALVPLMPESLRYLAVRPSPAHRARILAILRRFDPALLIPAAATIVAQPRAAGRNMVTSLFTEGRTKVTLLLWTAFFMNLVVMNFLNNWLPTLISGAGVPVEQAVRITTLFQLGGIAGVLLMGAVADRLGVWRLLIGAYLASGLFVGAIGLVIGLPLALSAAVALTGFCVIGLQMTLSAVAATLYPTAIRSTGTSWGLGIGRFGSTLGPLMGGVLVGWQWSLPVIFLSAVAPAFCGFLAVILLSRAARRQEPIMPVATAILSH
jgi:AAHS family 4-hydroxybenzoate transporter-like MFS transporter